MPFTEFNTTVGRSGYPFKANQPIPGCGNKVLRLRNSRRNPKTYPSPYQQDLHLCGPPTKPTLHTRTVRLSAYARKRIITDSSLGSEASVLSRKELNLPPSAWEQPTVGSHCITHSFEKKPRRNPPPRLPSERRGRTFVRIGSGSSNRAHTPTHQDRRPIEGGIATGLLRNHGLLGDVTTDQPASPPEQRGRTQSRTEVGSSDRTHTLPQRPQRVHLPTERDIEAILRSHGIPSDLTTRQPIT